jgi:tRNA(fMet)-specific endonuclease VapC
MVMSAVVNTGRNPTLAGEYRSLIGGRPVMISFATVTELRYGAVKAGWGELRQRGLERDLARVVIVQPDDRLMQVCAQLRVDCERAGLALGQKVHEADRWIAATAMRLGVQLVSDDGVFDSVPGLDLMSRSS